MTEDQRIEIVKQVPLFRDLDKQELQTVKGITIHRSYNRKSTIFTEGSHKEAVYFIFKGLVKALKTDENGHEQIVSFLKTGDMFPHTGLFNTSPYPATTEAIVDTQVLAIPVHSFEKLLLQTPSIAIKVLNVMGDKIKELQDKLQEFSGYDVNHRILSFLLKLVEQHGESRGEAIHIDLPVTNQELANSVGTTRETVSRLLNHLKKERILQSNRSGITVLDPEELQLWVVGKSNLP